ncbi:MAG: CU044_2847 family protein, partial [Pseudonocardiaceae bacterium]
GVRATVEGIATELAQVWEKVKPSEASVAFGLKLTAKSGKLTGLGRRRRLVDDAVDDSPASERADSESGWPWLGWWLCWWW